MKKIFIVLIIMIFAGVVFFLARNIFRKNNPIPPANNSLGNIATPNNIQNPPQSPSASDQNTDAVQNSSPFQLPLERAAERVTKKPFGIFITPQTSPVQPERFRGFHTGTDFEIFPDELNTDVPVHAICPGKIAMKRSASGYGGVLVQNCALNNQPITVVYGHLRLASISKKTGDDLSAGEEIGVLGKANSPETDEERKHLHLGIHKGSAINILGYVQAQSELSGWIDACLYICGK